jgi:signal transduction histidine kinase
VKSIRTRFFLHSFIPIICIYAAIVVAGMVFMNRNYEEQAVTQKSNDIQNISRAVNDWLISRTSEVIQLSQVPLIQTGETGEIERYLTDWRSRLAFIYEELYFVELDGSYWNSRDQRGSLENRVFVTRFTEEIPRYFYMGPVLGEPCFGQSVVLAAPVIRQGKIMGVLAAVIPVGVIDRMLGFFTFSEFDSYMLVDQFGRIITHSDDRHSGKSEQEVYGREFTRLCRYDESMVFVYVLKTTWKFVTFQPRSVLLGPVKRINGLVTVFFLVVIVILVLVSYTTTSRIVRPILRLTEGVERIMSGDYRQHIHIDTSDEMKTLADSFNRLSDRMIQIRTDDRFIFLGHIAARMAHEMRKPLHIIQLAALSMEARRRFGQKQTGLILKEVENADRFLKEILNFTKPDMLNLQKYSLPNLWKKILPKYRLVAEDLDIALDYRQDKEIPSFYMDILRLEEVFSNLLDNAFEAVQAAGQSSPGDTDGRRVWVRLENLAKEGVRVSITDTGPGFGEEAIDKAFDPYFTTKEHGTGLGLSISYRIISGHGAKIDLTNTEEGHGRVEILFPL